jgi:D-tagatose-1,6-bisphosphate aldolase subunit GatZ/KbaZ
MGSDHILQTIRRHKTGETVGIYSVCSAHRHVLEAARLQAKDDRSALLIESTANQVDQFGGYSGMNPKQFVQYLQQIARATDFPFERIILGGDHLGPNVWQNEPAAVALAKARDQVTAYVQAGYHKLHLDATMRCADDPLAPLPVEIIAERTAQLCQVAETARLSGMEAPVYVIGSDVPQPGGATSSLNQVHTTTVQSVEETLHLTKSAFKNKGLEHVWERVCALVVQPGIEFDHQQVFDYQSARAAELKTFIEKIPNFIYEAHSTDYQTPPALHNLVADHFAVLKVGPALTFAFREAVFALAAIEQEWLNGRKNILLSNLPVVIDREMAENPGYWQHHYHGDEVTVARLRKFSFSDRIRYYWPQPRVAAGLALLLKNMSDYPAPLTLLSQYLPAQYEAIHAGEILNQPSAIIHHKIRQVLQQYVQATGMNIHKNRCS